jgi:uncharacterized protein YjbI with pentapeptide repeats
MANKKQLKLLKKDVEGWNEWRKENFYVKVDLSKADLSRISLREADLSYANLTGANLREADLHSADLYFANLIDADLREANLVEATLFRANLFRANLGVANLCAADLRNALLVEADLSNALLIKADLSNALLSRADLSNANLTEAKLEETTISHTYTDGTIFKDCRIYGISTCGLDGTPASESGDLIITPDGQPNVIVDDFEVAQFVYLCLNSEKIGNVFDTIGHKGVLILGRFTPERKAVLDAIREELRRLDYVPIMFDFDKATDKDFTETIMTLAGMSRFVIADITNPSSSPLALQSTVPNYMVPFVPIIQEGEMPFSMFKDLYGKFDWVLKPLEYDTAENLVEKLDKGVINRSLVKHRELMLRKAEELQTVKLEDL